MHILSTLGRTVHELTPGQAVGVYVCGPTVQSEPHLGHGRAFVVFDALRRHLRWRGHNVRFVRNVTDIDDKIIAKAAERGVPWDVHARQMEEAFDVAMVALGVEPPDVEPRATEHIEGMQRIISDLIDGGHAYPAGGDVYFSVRSFADYGKLSGRKPDELRVGARIEVGEAKRDPLDFALWKGAKPGEPSWPSPWGDGRPGWHIECSAMARAYLGDGFEIHGGGLDLVFPHHENEIAQSEAAYGAPFARIWMHNGMLNLSGEKMAKSTGHVISLSEAAERYPGAALRLFYLRAHYRSPLEYSPELLDESVAGWERLRAFRRRAGEAASPDTATLEAFGQAMDDDLGTPQAISVLFELVKEGNRRLDAGGEVAGLAGAYDVITDVLGLVDVATSAEVPEALAALAAEHGVVGDDFAGVVDALVAVRGRARAEREWAVSDRIRDALAEMGVVIEDGADGAHWHRA